MLHFAVGADLSQWGAHGSKVVCPCQLILKVMELFSQLIASYQTYRARLGGHLKTVFSELVL